MNDDTITKMESIDPSTDFEEPNKITDFSKEDNKENGKLPYKIAQYFICVNIMRRKRNHMLKVSYSKYGCEDVIFFTTQNEFIEWIHNNEKLGMMDKDIVITKMESIDHIPDDNVTMSHGIYNEYDEADQYAIYSYKGFLITNVRLVVNHNDIIIPKNELKNGEIEAIISKVGCYIVRRALCKSNDSDYMYHEVSARHIDDLSGKFNIVCSARIPMNGDMFRRIKSISIIKENIYMPDNYASLQICEEISPLTDIPYCITFRMSPTGEVKEIH